MLKNIPKRENLNILNMVIENEKNITKSDLNAISSTIAVRLSHRFKNIEEGELYIDEICRFAKELYRNKLSQASGVDIKQEIIM